MSLSSHARQCLQLSAIVLILASLTPEVRGEKQVFAKVDPNAGAMNAAVESYDPATGTFTSLPAAGIAARQGHTSVLLKNGQVFLTGGYNGSYLASSAIYDPATGIFTGTGLMTSARGNHAAVLLNTSKVMVSGGYDGSSYLGTVEIYDPSEGSFRLLSVTATVAREGHTATLLSDGKVLLAGGYNGSYVSAAEIYDPGTDTFKATAGAMNSARRGHTATLLSDGKVLLAGGVNNEGYLNSAEIYDPATDKFTVAAGSMAAAREGHTAAPVSGGKVLIAGGFNGKYLNTAELYDPASGKFTATSGTMTAARRGHAATVLASGKVLLSGGYDGTYLKSAELFDPAAGSFTAQPGGMAVARYLHMATALPGGKILITGGQNSDLLTFDINSSAGDNVSPNIILTADSKVGFVGYTGSGVVVAFSAQTGEVLQRIKTEGYPALATPLKDGKTLAFVSVLDSRIFLIDIPSLKLKTTYSFANAQFGFGSVLALSPDGSFGYISSTGTAEIIKFNISDGKEIKRLGGFLSPTRITVNLDGNSLLAVDTTAVEVVVVDTSAMTRKSTLKLKDKKVTSVLSIFNSVVLGPDGASAVIAAGDARGTLTPGEAFIIKSSTADVLASQVIGSEPGFTGLTPDGRNWVVLCENSITVIPTKNPAGVEDIPSAQGDPLGSAGIAFSPDSRYGFYVSSTRDVLFQHDLVSTGVIGQAVIGDSPNRSHDQASSTAITPDGKIIAVAEFISNRIDLLSDVTVLVGTKFIISGDQFSGLSLVNLSDRKTRFTIAALDNYGQNMEASGIVNPAIIDLGPNGQISKSLAEIFNLDPAKEHVGRLHVTADQPQVAGYVTIGQIRATWLDYYLNRLDGVPLLRDQLYDWIVPEVGRDNNQIMLMDFVNSNYTQQLYDLSRYARDGTLIDQKADQLAYPTNRLEQLYSEQYPGTDQAKILIAGGQTGGASNNSAEIFSLSNAGFAATASMASSRRGHTATLLSDARVLVAGGKNADGVLNSAENYSISGGTFTSTAIPMTSSRYRHTATLLPSGRVLLAGGQNNVSVNSTAEIYDPSSDSFSATTGAMTSPRDAHTATLLLNGKVLIVGGIDGNSPAKTAEIYDPATGQFTLTGSMATARLSHTATILPNGRVLITGGFNGTYLSSAEIYDPASGTFSATKGNMNAPRGSHTATLLSNGTVLLAGGTSNSGVISSAEIYDPATDAFIVAAGTMASARSSHTAAYLGDGNVLLAGGTDGTNDLGSAERYDSSTQTFQATSSSMTAARSSHTATLLLSGAEGYLKGRCRKGMMFSEFFGATRDSGALNGIEIGKFAGVSSLYAPQVNTTSGYKAILNLVNANPDSDADVTIILHGADGKIIGTPVTRPLVKNAQLKGDLVNIFQGDPAVANVTGWLEIRTSADKVLGTVSYSNTDDSVVSILELSGKPLKDFVFPIAAEDAVYETVIALLNHAGETATVTVELWGPGGTLDRSTSLKLSPGSSISQHLGDYFPNLDPHTVANVRVHSDRPISGSGLLRDRQVHFLTAVPALPIPEKP